MAIDPADSLPETYVRKNITGRAKGNIFDGQAI
jgi:hypothetical protein